MLTHNACRTPLARISSAPLRSDQIAQSSHMSSRGAQLAWNSRVCIIHSCDPVAQLPLPSRRWARLSLSAGVHLNVLNDSHDRMCL